MTKNIKTFLIVLIVLIVTAGIVALVLLTRDKGGQQRRPGELADAQTTFSVKTQVTKVETLHDYVKTNGEIEAVNSIEVFPDMDGKVSEVFVSLGSPVKKGEIIAKIDPSEPGSKYSLSPVYAPISGSIVSTPTTTGSTITTTDAVTTIGDISNLQITADIPERFIAALHTGLKADISLEAYPGIIFKATVSRVSPVVDSTSRTKEIILTFDKHDSRINAGMFAKVILYTKNYSGYITIPEDSVVTKDDKEYAFVAKDDNTVSQRAVTLGESVDDQVQVLSGIKAGEKVVVEGMMVLADGSKINDITNNTSPVKAATSNTSSDSSKQGAD